MRVGIFTHYIDKYPRSAPSLYQKELIERLLKRNDVELVLIHHKKSDHRIYRLAEEAIISKIPYKREKEIKKLDLDLIHFNAIPWSWWPSISKLNIPTIATVHGTIHWDAPHLYTHTLSLIYTIRRSFETKVVKNITYFIAVSKYVEKILKEKLNIAQNNISTVYLPIDHSIFRPVTDVQTIENVKIKYGIRTGMQYILHVSNYSKAKNPDTLLKSFYVVRKEIDNIILVIAGSGWKNRFIYKMLKAFNLQNNVKILNWVPKRDLAILYCGALLLLHPSLHETFCFPIVEAMACGCPIVASSIMAIPEIADNIAIYCTPYDYRCFASAVLKIAKSDPQTRKEIVRRELKRAQLFDWKLHIEKIIKIYNKIALGERK